MENKGCTDRPNYIKVGRANILKEKSPIIWPQVLRYLSLQGEQLFSLGCVDRNKRNFIKQQFPKRRSFLNPSNVYKIH